MKSIKISLAVLLGMGFSSTVFAQLSPTTQRALERLYEEKVESRNAEYPNAVFQSNAESQHNEIHMNPTSSHTGAETSVAVNPTNHNNIVMSYMSDSANLSFPIFYSNDGGASWSKSSFNSIAVLASDYSNEMIGGGGDPVFEYDAQGNAYFSWIYLTIQNNQFDTAFMRMFWAKSTDGGQTWSHTKSMVIGQGAFLLAGGGIAAIAQYQDGIFDRQWFDVDRSGGSNDGTVYATSYVIPHGGNSLVEGMMVSTLPAGSSNAFQRGSYAGTGTTQFGNIVVDQTDGTVHVTYVDAATNQIFHASSTDGAQSFSTPVMIAQGVNLFPSSSNIVHGRENSAPSLAMDGAGNLHIAWTDIAGGQIQSYYSMSTDGGQTWTAAAGLATVVGTTGTPFSPTVAASGNYVAISFYNLNSAKAGYYEYAFSSDNGASFSYGDTLSSAVTAFKSFSGSAFFGDYNRSVMKGSTLYTTWVDGRNGSPQAYLAIDDLSNRIGVDEFSAITPDFKVGTAFPNPSSDVFKFDIETEFSGEVHYTVFGITGAMMENGSFQFRSGDNTVEISSRDWNSGYYTVLFQLPNGSSYMRKIEVIR